MAGNQQPQISEESQREKRKMSELNRAIPGGKRGLYNILTKDKGYHLPDYDCKCMTVDYLLGVANKKYYAPLLKDVVLKPIYKEVSTIQLMSELTSKISPCTWGFTSDCLPKYDWFMAIATVLDTNNGIFKPKIAYELETLVDLPKE